MTNCVNIRHFCDYVYVSQALSNMCDDIVINVFVCSYTCQIYLYFYINLYLAVASSALASSVVLGEAQIFRAGRATRPAGAEARPPPPEQQLHLRLRSSRREMCSVAVD